MPPNALEMRRKWSHWCNVTFKIRLTKRQCLPFRVLFLLLFHALTLRKVSCPTVSCPVERPTWQGGDALAKIQQGLEPSGQQYEWDWKQILHHVSLEMTVVPANSLIVACERDWDRDIQLNHVLIPDSLGFEITTVYCFMLLSLRVICYTAIGN